MRGAGLRLHNDVRRVWKCPQCGLERRAGAEVTAVRCECASNPLMQLVEAARKERPLKEPVSPYLEFVFEPGELNPPRPRDEEPPQDQPSGEVDLSGESASAENSGEETAPNSSRHDSRPARRPDRRDGPRSPGDRSSGGPPPSEGRKRLPRENRSARPQRTTDASNPDDTAVPESQPPVNPPPAATSDPADEFGAGL